MTLVQSDGALPICRKPSDLSLLGAFPALLRCACVSAFPILVQFLDSEFATYDGHQKNTEKKKKLKQLALYSFLMSSEPRPGPSSTK